MYRAINKLAYTVVAREPTGPPTPFLMSNIVISFWFFWTHFFSPLALDFTLHQPSLLSIHTREGMTCETASMQQPSLLSSHTREGMTCETMLLCNSLAS